MKGYIDNEGYDRPACITCKYKHKLTVEAPCYDCIDNADLDYSGLPLWCGSLSAHFDDKQLKQIAYHLVKAGLQSKNASDETQAELRRLIQFANGFHRAEKCGFIE